MSAEARTIAVLPVKRFATAKQRLAADLSAGTRRALVEAMVTDVLVGLRRAKQIDQVLVVTGDMAVEAVAHGYDAHTVAEPREQTHSAAAELGVAEAVSRGARRVLLVAGDTPALDPAQLDALITGTDADPGPLVVVVPDRHGDGTNALLLSPPEAITPAFGPGSREGHLALAREAGVEARVVEVSSLALDIDTAADVDALRVALGQWHGNAAHTRGMLSRLGRL